MRYFLRLSVGGLAAAAIFLAGCGHAASPPPKGAPAQHPAALHLSAGPVRAAANGEHSVVLTATGEVVGKSYSLAPTGAPFHRLGGPALSVLSSHWIVKWTEEGTSGRTRFTLSGPQPGRASVSSTVVVQW